MTKFDRSWVAAVLATERLQVGGGVDVGDGHHGAWTRRLAGRNLAGRRIALVNVEYRLPLLRVERGHGTWPLFIRQFHSSVFADAGHAWHDRFVLRQAKYSYGAELSVDVVAAFGLPLTLSVGGARGHDGSDRQPDQFTSYGRIGVAF